MTIRAYLLAAIYAIIAILSCVSAAAQDQFVSIGTYGNAGPFAFTNNGDYYTGSVVSSELRWSLRGNIFESGSFQQQAPIVGFNSHFWINTYSFAIDALGNVYELDSSTFGWSHAGTLGAMTGHEPSGQFIGLVSFEYGIRLVAITNVGDAYLHSHNGDWSYAGNIFTSAGIIPTDTQSLGSVKHMFR